MRPIVCFVVEGMAAGWIIPNHLLLVVRGVRGPGGTASGLAELAWRAVLRCVVVGVSGVRGVVGGEGARLVDLG